MQTARWRLRHTGRHGVRNLRFGQTTATLICDDHGGIEVETQRPFQLQVNGKSFTAEAGRSVFPQVRLP